MFNCKLFPANFTVLLKGQSRSLEMLQEAEPQKVQNVFSALLCPVLVMNRAHNN